AADTVFGRPLHPYARALLAAVPRLDRGRSAKLQTIEGAPPNLLNPPEGCRFRPRCRHAVEACHAAPETTEAVSGHTVACHRWPEFLNLAADPPAAGSRAPSGNGMAPHGAAPHGAGQNGAAPDGAGAPSLKIHGVSQIF